MATNLSLIQDVYKLWRRPAQARLPLDVVFLALSDEAAMLAQVLSLSRTETRLVAVDFNPASVDAALPANNISLPVAIETRPTGADPDDAWTPLDLIPYRDYLKRYAAGDDVATIYATSTGNSIKFSQSIAGRDFTLYYPLLLPAPSDISTIGTASPAIDTAWQTLLKYAVAVRVGPQIAKSGAKWKEYFERNITSLVESRNRWEALFREALDRDNAEVTYDDEIINGIYQLWRKPALKRLPMDTVFSVLQDECALLSERLELSSTEERLLLVPFAPATIDAELPSESFGLPRAVEKRPTGSDSTVKWQRLEVVPFRQFADRTADGGDVTTFSGSDPAHIQFSQDVSGFDFQLWYPLLLSVPAKVGESPKLDSAWHRLVKYAVALKVGPLIFGHMTAEAQAEWAAFYAANMKSLQGSKDEWTKLFDTYLERDNPEQTYPTPLIEGIYDLWGFPSQKKLPLSTVFRVLQDEARMLSEGMILSTQSQALVPVSLNPNTQDFPLDVTSLQLPTVVKWRPLESTPDTVWQDLDIVSFRSFSARQRSGDDVVTFYGTGTGTPHAVFSLDVQGREFQLWHPFPIVVPQRVTEDPQVDEAWQTLLKYATAVKVGSRIKDTTKEWRTFFMDNMPSLVETRGRWEKMFKSYLERDYGETSYKEGFSDPSGGYESIGFPRA